ncbi:hypothetical protein QP519_09355 [Weeksella virosa]|uniref:hypothetical protein n=1 Tax=Weeksella virosa TaxID=1014 RepID=UPI002556DD30|nr:hypothetical protein [Weeksella virosa]MDK7375739.1 hypothetical protein [Weeksella virosa]
MSNSSPSVIQLQNELAIVLREKKLGAKYFGLFQEPIDEKIAHLQKQIKNKIEQLKTEAEWENYI